MLIILLFIIGIVFGSFFNVLIDRLYRNESIFLNRSHCDNCKKKLSWYDLFPVFSYLALKGKCRFCKSKIPFRVFLVELLSGIIFSALFYGFLISKFSFYEFLFLIFTSSCFIVIFFADIDYGIIPDQILLALFLFCLGFVILTNPSTLLLRILSALGSAGFFLLLFLITKGKGMGFGDVKFAAVLGFLFPFPEILISHYVAFLTGAVISIILILWKKKKLKGTTVPFGPFMVLGAIVSYFFTSYFIRIFFGFL